jgi:transcriptional regulator with XRE-family HTH domain
MPVETSRLTSKLFRWRADAGLTLEEVSDLTGLSVAMLSRVERRKRQMRPETKVRMARRLGVPVRDLFEVEELNDGT